MISGQVLLTLQVSSRPAGGKLRAKIGKADNHIGASSPIMKGSRRTSGKAKRLFMKSIRPSISDQTPLETILRDSSWLNREKIVPRRNAADWDTPSLITLWML